MDFSTYLNSNLESINVLSATISSYLLIFAAEIGDKSQLVCMALAARYRALPVMLAAILAFIILNTLAVVFGLAIANWLPEVVITMLVAILFTIFAAFALRIEEKPDDEVMNINSKNLFVATFLLIVIAEFGDKTQLAVIALSSTSIPIAVWLGATAALISTSVLGVWAGRTVLQRIPMTIIHRISGLIFICLAMFAAYKSYLLLGY